jgi:hypothetical protein
MGQQPFFAIETAAEAGQRAVGTDHPMTGNDDSDRIAAIREADGPRSVGIVQALGELSVAARLTERNFCQFAPDALLKLGAIHAQRQIEFAALAGEIFFQLARSGWQRVDGGILNPVVA